MSDSAIAVGLVLAGTASLLVLTLLDPVRRRIAARRALRRRRVLEREREGEP